jgi:hypothetical protein
MIQAPVTHANWLETVLYYRSRLHPAFFIVYALASAAGSEDSALGASVAGSAEAAGASADGSASEDVQRV